MKPYVIAEIGNNHQGDLETCKEMFREAKRCGADAVKLQKRDNKSLFTDTAYNAPYENENSYGKTYGEHREFLEFGKEEYVELKELSKELDIDFFATAFDIPSADFLEELDMPMYKIASADITNIPLIDHVASFGKSMIVSTGGATLEDIYRVSDEYKEKIPLTILHCVASYPNKSEELNLKVISSMQRLLSRHVKVGFSNHHPSVYMNYIAYAMGAKVIEVHFTLNRASKGTDHAFSLEPKGLETLCSDLESISKAFGNGEKEPLESEKKPIEKMSKSIYPSKNIKKGEAITHENTRILCPGDGLKPYELENIIGKTTNKDLSTEISIKKEDLT